MQRTKEVMPQRSTQAKKHDEFSQLRSVIPTMSERSYSAPIDVIEEAIKYIAHLQATLEDHNSSSLTTEEVQQQFRDASCNLKSEIKTKERRIASFHRRLESVPKPRTLKGQDKRRNRRQQQKARANTTT